jgi:hypothetical protein
MFGWVTRLYSPVVVNDTIPAPPDAVYAVLEEPSTYPDWLVGAHDVRSVDPDFPEPGTDFDHSVGPGGPLTVDDSTEAIGADEDRRLALLVHAGPFHARVDFELRTAPDGGTDLCFSEVPVGVFRPITPLLRPMLAGRNKESLRRLRERILETAR